MPSLADQLKKNQQNTQLVRGAGGVLSEQAPATNINTLAGQQGLAVAPTTALGGVLAGANPDQQKMLGGPAQLKAIADKNQAPTENLQTAVRRQQVRTEATGQEQQAIQKSEAMQNLGGLGDRVTNFINAQKQKLDTESGNQEAVQPEAATQFGDKDITGLKNDLKALRSNPTDMQLMLKVQQALGMDVNKQLAPEEINRLYQSSVDAIAQGGASAVADKLNVEDLTDNADFGYDLDTLSNLLDVPADQLRGMTVGQLSNEVNRVTDQEFNKTQQLEQQAQSGQLGMAERGLARQAAKEASATGLRATEDDMNRLGEAVAGADQVQFGGKTYKVDELLQDDTISGIIKEYMEAGPNSELRKTIESSEPELAKFIKAHGAALEDASKQLAAGATEFSKIQQDNKNLVSNIFGSGGLDPAVQQAILPQLNSLQTSRVDPNSVPLLAYAQQQGPQGAQKVAAAISTEQQRDPSVAGQLAQLNPEQLQNLGIGKAGSNWEKMSQANQIHDDIISTDPNQNPDKLFIQAYGITPREAEYRTVQNDILAKLGLPSSPVATSDPNQIKQNLLNQFPGTSVTQAASGELPNTQKQQFGNVKLPVPGSAEDGVYRFLGPILENTGGTLKLEDVYEKDATNSWRLKNKAIDALNKTGSDGNYSDPQRQAIEAALARFGLDEKSVFDKYDKDRWAKVGQSLSNMKFDIPNFNPGNKL